MANGEILGHNMEALKNWKAPDTQEPKELPAVSGGSPDSEEKPDDTEEVQPKTKGTEKPTTPDAKEKKQRYQPAIKAGSIVISNRATGSEIGKKFKIEKINEDDETAHLENYPDPVPLKYLSLDSSYKARAYKRRIKGFNEERAGMEPAPKASPIEQLNVSEVDANSSAEGAATTSETSEEEPNLETDLALNNIDTTVQPSTPETSPSVTAGDRVMHTIGRESKLRTVSEVLPPDADGTRMVALEDYDSWVPEQDVRKLSPAEVSALEILSPEQETPEAEPVVVQSSPDVNHAPAPTPEPQIISPQRPASQSQGTTPRRPAPPVIDARQATPPAAGDLGAAFEQSVSQSTPNRQSSRQTNRTSPASSPVSEGLGAVFERSVSQSNAPENRPSGTPLGNAFERSMSATESQPTRPVIDTSENLGGAFERSQSAPVAAGEVLERKIGGSNRGIFGRMFDSLRNRGGDLMVNLRTKTLDMFNINIQDRVYQYHHDRSQSVLAKRDALTTSLVKMNERRNGAKDKTRYDREIEKVQSKIDKLNTKLDFRNHKKAEYANFRNTIASEAAGKLAERAEPYRARYEMLNADKAKLDTLIRSYSTRMNQCQVAYHTLQEQMRTAPRYERKALKFELKELEKELQIAKNDVKVVQLKHVEVERKMSKVAKPMGRLGDASNKFARITQRDGYYTETPKLVPTPINRNTPNIRNRP